MKEQITFQEAKDRGLIRNYSLDMFSTTGEIVIVFDDCFISAEVEPGEGGSWDNFMNRGSVYPDYFVEMGILTGDELMNQEKEKALTQEAKKRKQYREREIQERARYEELREKFGD